jgi:ADP-heptose:LPS heptosyltransferase
LVCKSGFRNQNYGEQERMEKKLGIIKKALVIKLCCIGDIIQATPALRSLSESGVEVNFLCNKWVSELVDMVPYVKKKFEVNQSDAGSVIKTIRELRREKYDLVINLHRDIKSYVFLFILGARYRAGFKWKGRGSFLTHSFRFDEKAHESKRYSGIVEGLGFSPGGGQTSITAPAPDKKEKGKIRIGLFPGGGKNPGTVMTTKRWPVENFVELAGKLGKDKKQIFFFGSIIDNDVLDNVKCRMPDAELIITNTLKELANKISGMDVFIAGDTGPLHMAAALGVKAIGLFGPSSPELVGPPGEHVINIRGDASCAPCYEPGTVHKKGFLKCADNVCMKNISVKMVLEGIEKLLKI